MGTRAPWPRNRFRPPSRAPTLAAEPRRGRARGQPCRRVHSLYQPVVHLQTRTIIGYEALARGPEGTDLYTPDALFAAARARGTLGELDWACRIAAFDGAVKAHLPSTLELFVNVEAAALNAPPPPGAAAALSAAGGLSVVIELTERDLTAICQVK